MSSTSRQPAGPDGELGGPGGIGAGALAGCGGRTRGEGGEEGCGCGGGCISGGGGGRGGCLGLVGYRGRAWIGGRAHLERKSPSAPRMVRYLFLRSATAPVAPVASMTPARTRRRGAGRGGGEGGVGRGGGMGLAGWRGCSPFLARLAAGPTRTCDAVPAQSSRSRPKSGAPARDWTNAVSAKATTAPATTQVGGAYPARGRWSARWWPSTGGCRSHHERHQPETDQRQQDEDGKAGDQHGSATGSALSSSRPRPARRRSA